MVVYFLKTMLGVRGDTRADRIFDPLSGPGRVGLESI